MQSTKWAFDDLSSNITLEDMFPFAGSMTSALALDQPLPPLNLKIKDLTPKFLAFYYAARTAHSTPR